MAYVLCLGGPPVAALKPYCRLSTKKRRHLFCSFKNTTMSLTSAIAMTRENACTERSTESNQPHRPIVSSPPNASAEFESSTRSGGALCWERANGESVTPVVSPTSVDCPGPAIVTTTSKVAKSISQYSVSTSVLAGAQSPDAGSRSEEIQVSFHACFACFRAILTRFPHIAFSGTFLIVLPPPALCSHTPYSRMSPLYVFFPLSPCVMCHVPLSCFSYM